MLLRNEQHSCFICLFKTVQHFPMELIFIQPVLGQKLRPAGIGAYAALFVIGAYND